MTGRTKAERAETRAEVEKMIGENRGRIMRFDELSEPAQLAAAQYHALVGSAWELPADLDTFDPRTDPRDGTFVSSDDVRVRADQFKASLPWFRGRYGNHLFGYVEIPMAEIDAAITRRYGTGWKEGPAQASHGPRAPWPVVLDRTYDYVIQDGAHRLERYYELGMETVPALYYPTEAEEAAATRFANQEVFGPRIPLAPGITYRVKQDGRGTLLAVYSGRRRVGAIEAYLQMFGKTVNCPEEVDALRERFPQVGNQLFLVFNAALTEGLRGRGLGVAMYEALMRAIYTYEDAPFILAPAKCGPAVSTSKAAIRVWRSLARKYPSSGDVVAVLSAPRSYVPNPVQLKRRLLR